VSHTSTIPFFDIWVRCWEQHYLSDPI